MAGRRPKPTALKLVTGTQRVDRVREGEPTPPDAPVLCPKHVQYRAAELWEEYAPALIAMGTLTAVDVPNFAAWCRLTARFEEIGAEMPASHIAQIRLLGADFGIGASARAKLGTGGKAEKKDPAEQFFEKGHGKTG